MKLRSRFVALALLAFLPELAFGEELEEKSVEPNSGYVAEEFINYKIAENPLDRIPPYRDRRESSGAMLSVGYGQFQPTEYQPQFVVESYDEVYSTDETGLYDISLAYKLNFFLGSLSLGIGVGVASSLSADIALFGDSEVKFIPYRIEVTFALDTLFPQPILVPYGMLGAYAVYYSETEGSKSASGTTEAALFFAGGASLQMDWLFPEEALAAYKENGQESTFLYVEGRKYLASSQTPSDPDFETDIMWNVGVKLEF
ncbi:MAG: hypothetical protein SGJ18_10180 [Pseudomonadota bacterium]|nr:hypothetical protein [Pseudomonadota bacterium]